MTSSKKGINTFQLKIFGLIFMTLDHIGQYLYNRIDMNPLRILGRIAAPLFLYVTVISLSHTKSRVKYALRLYTAHVLICLFTLFATTIGEELFGSHDQFSILSTFLYVVLFVSLIEKMINFHKSKTLPFLFCCFLMIAIIVVPLMAMHLPGNFSLLASIFLPDVLTVPYSPFFVLMGILWYFAGKKSIQMAILVFFSFLSMIGSYLSAYSNIWLFTGFFNPIQFFMILFLPFLYWYCDEKGKSLKRFFYIYYPAHIFVLMLIGKHFL